MMLDDLQAIERVDRHDTRRILAKFSEHCRQGHTLRPTPALTIGRPRLVVLAGMGGSAAGGDLIAACAADTLDVPILVHRGYGLPAAARRESLVVALSYSGDTAEVLSAVDVALERGIPVVAVTAGGTLGALAQARALPRVTLPSGLMPRMALGYLALPLLTVLTAVGVPAASAADVEEALGVLEDQSQDLVPECPSDKNEAKRLALAIGTRLPAIYGGPLTGAVAYRWKTDLEENAKILAIAGAVPEMNHNEIEAWSGPGAGARHAVILREDSESPEIARRFTLLRDLLDPAAGGISEVWARGRGRLARVLSLVSLGQWVSYYVAMLHGTDPWPVPVLTEVKRRLAAPVERRPLP